jgi:hypothetical protein
MSARLDIFSYDFLKRHLQLSKTRKNTFKIMCLNRNRKIVFVELSKYYDFNLSRDTLYSCVLPEDLFILCIFNENNKVFNFQNIEYLDLQLKEVYFYQTEIKDFSLIYGTDFRNKDTFFKILLPYIENYQIKY